MLEALGYESILESISGGFLALDDQYRVTYWNHAAEIGTGLSADEVLGKNVFEIFPNAEHAELGRRYRLAMESREYQSFETSYKDERFEAWYDVRMYPSMSGLSVFFQDITEKKRQEKQKEILVAISRAINNSKHLDELCLQSGKHVALMLETPSKFVSVFLFDPKQDEIRLVAPALLDIEFPPGVIHQPVREDAPLPACQAAYKR